MKRLNVKLLVILLVSSTTAVAGTYGLWKYQMDRNSGNSLQRAEAAYESGDFAAAIENLRRYLGFVPEDTEQRVTYAKWVKEWYEDGGEVNIPDVMDALRRAVEDNREDVELRRMAAEFCMEPQIRAWDEAINHWEVVLRQQGENASAEDKVKLAECYFHSTKQNNDDLAMALLVPLVGFQPDSGNFDPDQAQAPGNVQAYVLLARIYREHKLNNQPVADGIIVQAVRANPDFAEAHYEYSRYLNRYGGEALQGKADEEAQIALNLEPDNPEIILQAAKMAFQQGRNDEAKTLLYRGVEQYPKDVQLTIFLSNVLRTEGDGEAALEVLRETMQKVPGNWELLNSRVTLEIGMGNVEAAKKSLEEARRWNMPLELQRFYSAQIDFMEGRWASARRQLEEVRVAVEKYGFATAVDFRLMQCYDLLGFPDLQLEAIRRLRHRSDELEYEYLEAKTLQTLGMNELAEQVLEHLATRENFSSYSRALEVVMNLISLKTEQQMKLPEEERDWTQVDRLLDQVAPADDLRNAGLVNFRIQNWFSRDMEEQARELLQRAREEYPEDQPLWLTYIASLTDEQGPEQALAEIEKFKAIHGDGYVARATQATLLARMGGEDLSERLRQLQEGLDGWSDDDRYNLRSRLAVLHMQTGNPKHAMEMWGAIADELPQNLIARLRQFEIAHRMGNEAVMVDCIEEVEHLMGRSDATWKLTEALHQIWLYQNDLAGPKALTQIHRYLDEARTQRPQWHRLYLLQGQLALIEGQPEIAVTALEDALDKGPRDPGVLHTLVGLLLELNRGEEARRWLESVEESELTEGLKRLQLAMEAESGGGGEELRARIDEYFPADSQSADDMVSRAQLMVALGAIDEAEQALRRAVQLAPTSSKTWMQLVALLARQKRVEEAELMIRQARMRLPENEVPLAIGQMYASLGSYVWAEQFYQMALAANPDSTTALRMIAAFYLRYNHAEQASRYLNQILEDAKPNTEVVPFDVAWARREKAKLLAASGNYQDYLRAVGLIEANQPADQELSDVDLHLLATLAVRRPESMSRQRAIRLLEERRDGEDAIPDDLLLDLAKLYHTMDRSNESRKLVFELLGHHPDSQETIVFYVEILEKTGEYNEMSSWIEKLDPNSYYYIQKQSQLWAQNGRITDAVNLVRRLLPQGVSLDDYEPEQYALLLQAAILMQSIAEFDESQNATAERLFREYAQRVPGDRLRLPYYLGTRHDPEKVEEAFQLLEEALGGGFSVVSVTRLAVDILRQNQDWIANDSHYYQLVDQWFELGARQFHNRSDLLIQRANFEELRGNYDQALAYYRSCLELGDLDSRMRATVQNNIAFVKAMQGECEEPLELVNKAIDDLGPSSVLLDTRAVVYLACGDSRRAIADMTRALIDGKDPVMVFHLARAFHEDGQRQQAEQKLREAFDEGLDPDSLFRVEQRILSDMMSKYGIDESEVALSSSAR